jgi:ferredoxin-fold anticodon binding domain-containing protein
MNTQEYRELLNRIASRLSRENLESMKFLCGYLPHIQQETVFVKEVFNFFRELEKQQRLGIDNLDFLKRMLDEVEKDELANRVNDFQDQRKSYLDSLSPAGYA